MNRKETRKAPRKIKPAPEPPGASTVIGVLANGRKYGQMDMGFERILTEESTMEWMRGPGSAGFFVLVGPGEKEETKAAKGSRKSNLNKERNVRRLGLLDKRRNTDAGLDLVDHVLTGDFHYFHAHLATEHPHAQVDGSQTEL